VAQTEPMTTPLADAAAGSGPSAPVVAAPPVPVGPMTARRRVRAFVALTKPRIIELLLVTTVPTMVLAAQGWPGTGS
jgi:heme o synthase